MKLRNKKTGEIINAGDVFSLASYDEHGLIVRERYEYGSLSELCKEWEDYKPAEPLIKDEKVRKAVRAWAKINNFAKVKLLVSPEYGSQFEGGYGFSRITFSGITLEYLDYPKEYTIAELCGEEEE